MIFEKIDTHGKSFICFLFLLFHLYLVGILIFTIIEFRSNQIKTPSYNPETKHLKEKNRHNKQNQLLIYIIAVG